jgi:hypothetical protein
MNGLTRLTASTSFVHSPAKSAEMAGFRNCGWRGSRFLMVAV